MTTFKKNNLNFSWSEIETVLLDMDGTLLDKHFDDYFWEQYVPENYSLLHDIPIDQARLELLYRYKKFENTLSWTDLNHWSLELGLDIPELKLRVEHLIDVHPYVKDFLKFLKRIGKKIFLVTNAHPKTLAIKLKKTELGPWFDRIICSDELGFAKEQPNFWDSLEKKLEYSREKTLLADDTERVLLAAQRHGIKHLIFIARPSSRKEIQCSEHFPSIEYFNELIFD